MQPAVRDRQIRLFQLLPLARIDQLCVTVLYDASWMPASVRLTAPSALPCVNRIVTIAHMTACADLHIGSPKLIYKCVEMKRKIGASFILLSV